MKSKTKEYLRSFLEGFILFKTYEFLTLYSKVSNKLIY